MDGTQVSSYASARARANSSPSVVGRHWTPVSLRSLKSTKTAESQHDLPLPSSPRRTRAQVRAPAPGRASHMRHLYGMDMLCPGKARIARRRRGRGISSHPCARARGRTDGRTDERNDGEEQADAAGRGPDAMLFKHGHGLCEEVTSAPRYPPHYSTLQYGAARTDSGFGVRARVLRSWKRNDHLEGGEGVS